jgi:(1->4)-alpha-D-glucan 1-alpha-D-glucosylmutase
MDRLRVPVATYRLQFSGRFRFEDARSLITYLHRLGISDLYASPVLAARRGSPHGYDVIDPARLNPELGTDEGFDLLAAELKAHGMGLLLDIVPNHMAAVPENPWWMDVLENGQSSAYADYFDIDWDPPETALRNKMLLPVLGKPYRQALEDQELALMLDGTGISVRYRDLRLPLNLQSHLVLIADWLRRLEGKLSTKDAIAGQFSQILREISHLVDYSPLNSRQAVRHRARQKAVKKKLYHLAASSPELKSTLMETIGLFSGQRGDTGSSKLLDGLLKQQAYELAFWRDAGAKINYRRFFDLSDLIGIHVEKPRVFKATHAAVLRLVGEGKVTGLRIDHIDGLADPLGYLVRLQGRIAPEAGETGGERPGFYVVVEKILGSDEALPPQWPVSGTTGYDFLNLVNTLFVDVEGARALAASYARLTSCEETFDDVAYAKKSLVIDQLFAGEVKALGSHLASLARLDREAEGVSLEDLAGAIKGVTAGLPVYRTYTRNMRVSRRDKAYVEQAVREAGRREPSIDAGALGFLRRVLLLEASGSISTEEKKDWLRFVVRWQQFSGSVTAKGLEDTAFYNYNRLVSLNEVGGDPGANGLSIEAFHQRNLERQMQWPHTLNPTSTHDTKRGEDVRARLNVLSELPDEWEECLTRWQQWNRPKKCQVKGQPVPDANMELLLYQTLVGAWPYSQEMTGFEDRLKAYLVKAAREAKAFTSWLWPDPGYEEALLAFVESVLDTSGQNAFLEDLLRLQGRVAYYGAFNSLSQLLLKITSPGVPDFYQGNELWDLNLVDPDNRRPVDFRRREAVLYHLMQQEESDRPTLMRDLLASWEDARAKLYVSYKALNVRRAQPDLFLSGDYIPLQVRGERRGHVCAFARRHGKEWALVAVPRFLASLVPAGTLPLGPQVWGDDRLLLPDDSPREWRHIFTGEVFTARSDTGLPVSLVFGLFPVAVLLGTA